MRLVIGKEYPAAPPKGFFLTKIFHPNVGPAGDICVNTLKKDWAPDVLLSHVLQVVRCLLINPFPESSLNDDAGKLFMEDYAAFADRARLMTSIHASAPAAAAGGGGGGAAAGGGGGGGAAEGADGGASGGGAGGSDGEGDASVPKKRSADDKSGAADAPAKRKDVKKKASLKRL